MQEQIKQSLESLKSTLKDLEDTTIPDNQIQNALELLGYLESQVTDFMFELNSPLNA